MKYKSGEVPMVGDAVRCDSITGYTVTEVGSTRITLTHSSSQVSAECIPSVFTLLSRAPSATPGEDRFAAGAYWESRNKTYTDVVVANPANNGESGAWCIAFDRRQAIRAQRNVEVERPCRTYRGNVADQVERFLIALTRACPVTVGGVRYESNKSIPPGTHYVFRQGDFIQGDTLPSSAPTGSFVVGGCEYDEIPSRYGEADEDAIFKKQSAKFAKLREEETAALGRFERIKDIVTASVEAWAPRATVTVDKVIHNAALVAIQCDGEREEFALGNHMIETDVASSVDVAISVIGRAVGARAMRGGK